MMITNDAGQVALKNIKQPAQPKYVHLGNGHEYVFSSKAGVSLSWVAPNDVIPLLNIKEGCCGNAPRPVFAYASEADIQRWTS